MDKRIILCSLAFLLAISIVSFIHAQTTIETGAIYGHVLPVDSNATIYAILPVNEIVGFSTINSSGDYSITLPSGIYDLQIVAQGGYINRTLFQIGVQEDQMTEVQEILLAKPGETGSIYGYINPIIEGTVVKIKKFGLTDYAGEFVVGKDGKYYFTNLEPNVYGLFVKFNQSQEFYDYHWSMIDIAADSSLSEINLTFTPKNSTYSIDRIMISFNDGVSETEKINIIKSYGGLIMSHYSYSTSYTISIPSGKTVSDMVELFKNNSDIKSVYPVDRLYSGVSEITIEEYKEDKNNTNTPILKEILQNISTEPLEISKPKEENSTTSFFQKLIQFLKQLFNIK